jgi:archaemetzincin
VSAAAPICVRLLEDRTIPRWLGDALSAALPAPLRVRSRAPLGLDLEPLVDRQRGQLDASRLLELLPAPAAGDDLVLALVTVDLFLPVLSYVFGASTLGAGRSVLSLGRLRAELSSPTEDARRLLARRATIEAVHELGHGLGLVHCPAPGCPMHRTLWPEAVDLKAPEPCPACAALIAARCSR